MPHNADNVLCAVKMPNVSAFSGKDSFFLRELKTYFIFKGRPLWKRKNPTRPSAALRGKKAPKSDFEDTAAEICYIILLKVFPTPRSLTYTYNI